MFSFKKILLGSTYLHSEYEKKTFNPDKWTNTAPHVLLEVVKVSEAWTAA